MHYRWFCLCECRRGPMWLTFFKISSSVSHPILEWHDDMMINNKWWKKFYFRMNYPGINNVYLYLIRLTDFASEASRSQHTEYYIHSHRSLCLWGTHANIMKTPVGFYDKPRNKYHVIQLPCHFILDRFIYNQVRSTPYLCRLPYWFSVM